MLVASHNGFFSGRKEQGAQHNWKDQSIECANHNKDRDRATNKREDEGRKNDKSSRICYGKQLSGSCVSLKSRDGG